MRLLCGSFLDLCLCLVVTVNSQRLFFAIGNFQDLATLFLHKWSSFIKWGKGEEGEVGGGRTQHALSWEGKEGRKYIYIERECPGCTQSNFFLFFLHVVCTS